MDRRTWFQLLATVSVASAQQPLTREHLDDALKLLGLEFDDKQKEMMLAGLKRAMDGYDKLRKIDVPLDTEPAIAFHPGLPGRALPSGKPRFQPLPRRAPQAVPKDEDLAYLPVTELAALLRSKKVTSTQLTELYLARLKKHAPTLNCVITFTEERARRQAARADEEIRKGKYRGPLHGIPWGAKDLFATKGVPTTWGAEPFRGQIIDYDATVVERLDNAGAVLIAKLSMGALAMGGLWFGGMTKTPWKTDLTSSGSSAGSAAATAAGLVGFALGTETLGSIVTPSIRCGTVGLRPTYGRVSRYGAMGLSWTMDKVGPICRGVEDCALVLNAIHGPDGKDRTVTADPLHWEPAKPLSQLRIGVLQKAFDETKGDDKKIYDQALADLAKAGVSMKPVEVEDKDSAQIIFLLNAEAAAAFDDITRDGRVAQLKDQAANAWPNSFRTSRLIPAVEYLRAQRVRTLLQQRMERLFAEWDVLVGPPFTLLRLTNLTGHPEVVVRCGFVDGMPRGLGFYGPLYNEGAPLRVALAYEQATAWHTQRPPGF